MLWPGLPPPDARRELSTSDGVASAICPLWTRPRPARRDSTTAPSSRKTRYRSNVRANQRSWVTASTVPSYAASACCSASALIRSRLSVGSSSSSIVVPDSSSSSTCSRACCPPESTSKRSSACSCSPYRRSAPIARPLSKPDRRPSPRQRMSTSVRPARSGRSWVCANSPGSTRAPSFQAPVCATGSPASSRRKCDLPEPLEPSTATRSPKNTSRSNGFISPVSSSPTQVSARTPVRPPRSRIATCCSTGRSGGGPAASNLASRVCMAR